MRKKSLVICFFLVGLILLSQQINKLQINSLESMLKIAQGKEKLDLLERLIEEYGQSNFDKRLEYALEGVKISRELKNKQDEIYFLYVTGDIYFDQNRFTDAIEFYQKSYYLSQNYEDSLQQSIITERIGIVFQDILNYDKALEYYLLTLKLREKKSDNASYAAIMMNIGNLYYDLEKYEIAYEYYQKTHEIFIKTENQLDIAGISVNLGNVYQEMNKSEKALKHYRQALLIFRELDDQYGIAQVFNNMGTVFLDQENNVEALVYFQSSEKTIRKIDNTYLETLISLNLGATYINLNFLEEARTQLKKCLKLAVINKLIDMRLSAYYELSRLYSKLNSSAKTYEFSEKYINLKDSIFSEESDKRIANLRIQYELNTKEEEIEDLYQAKETQLKIRNYFILMSILILLLLIVLFILFRNKIRSNRMLAESRKKFQDMFEKHSAIMLLIDPDNGDIVNCNKAALEYYGFMNTKGVFANLYNISTSPHTVISKSLKESLIKKQSRIISQHRLSDNRIRDIELFSTPIEFGNKILIYAIVQDITEQLHYENELKLLNIDLENRIDLQVKKVQKQQELLMQKSKLESLGKLAAGIAHEINQPIGGISLSIDNLLIKFKKKELTLDYLSQKHKKLMESIDKIRNIINQVRTFSRDQQFVSLDKVDISKVIYDSISMLDVQFKNHNVDLKVRIEENIGLIIGNKHKMEQVVLNLLSNAKDAVDERAKKLKENDYKKSIFINAYPKSKKIQLAIKDNGIGIPEEFQQKIFDPFYTTKDPEKGTGLGLSIIYGIIEEMKGSISVESKINNYTLFRITIPMIIKNEKKA